MSWILGCILKKKIRDSFLTISLKTDLYHKLLRKIKKSLSWNKWVAEKMREMQSWHRLYSMNRIKEEQHKVKWFNQLKRVAHQVTRLIKKRTKVKFQRELQKEKEKLNQAKTKKLYNTWKWRKNQDKFCDLDWLNNFRSIHLWIYLSSNIGNSKCCKAI